MQTQLTKKIRNNYHFDSCFLSVFPDQFDERVVQSFVLAQLGVKSFQSNPENKNFNKVHGMYVNVMKGMFYLNI